MTTESAVPTARCWPWSHQWSKWEMCLGETQDEKGRRMSSGWRYQRRHCVHCGYIQQTSVGLVP